MNNLAYYRNKKGLTQRQMAEILNISQPVLAQYERGTKHPSQPIWRELSEFFGATVGQLIGTEPVDAE